MLNRICLWLIPLSLVTFQANANHSCKVESGTGTTALIELYTSEGCSSCPPAEKYLNQLDTHKTIDGDYVPVALHVDYWDYIGWKDKLAQPKFAQRQKWLVRLNKKRTSYTPHFFVSGAEFLNWRRSIHNAVKTVNKYTAEADISLSSSPITNNKLQVTVTAKSLNHPSAALYLAITESGLKTKVKRGENRGVTLHHDHVARTWLGPVKLENGQLKLEQEFELPAEWDQSKLSILAFVQDQQSGIVLQALRNKPCNANQR